MGYHVATHQYSRGDARALLFLSRSSETPKCQLSSNAVNTRTAVGNECFYFHLDTRATPENTFGSWSVGFLALWRSP